MKRFSPIVISLILIISFGYTIQNRWGGSDGGAWKGIIGSDGYSYYAYLPCIFIYHEFNYPKILEVERKFSPGVNDFTARFSVNQRIDKCFIGVAILLAPFFLLAYLLSYLMGSGLDGYDYFFQIAVSTGALFYLSLGLIYLRKLIKLYCISELITGIVLILVVFGTNVFYYATMEPSMSHIYSFGLMAFFLFHLKKSIDEFKAINLAWMVTAIAILVLIRPTNLLGVLIIPFFAGSYKGGVAFIVNFFKNKKLVYFLLIVAAVLSVQFIVWFAETGHLFVWSYPGEGFNFAKPYFFDELFSYCKGWFVYTPLMLIALVGGLFAYRRNYFSLLFILFFFLLVTFILSSWSTWWYGGSFGLRAFIDFYPFFALLLAIFLNSLNSPWVKVPFIVLTLLCLCLNQIQTFQYTHSILPPDGMTKDRYWKIFLKTDHAYVGIFDFPITGNYNYFNNYYFTNNFENNTWENNDNINTMYSLSGKHSAFANEQHPNTPVFSMKFSELPQAKPLFIYVRLWAFMPDFSNNAEIVTCVQDDKGGCSFWKTRFMQGFVFERNLWTLTYSLVELPDIKKPTDELKVYVLNTKGIVYIDNMEVTFGTPK